MSQLSELQQRVASFVETAYEAGYDAAAEPAYNAGYEDGIEQGKREGFNEALDIVATTSEAFSTEDPGDACDCFLCITGAEPEESSLNPLSAAFDTYLDSPDEEPCDCPFCTGEYPDDDSLKIALTGDYAADVPSLVQGLRVMVDDTDAIGELLLTIDEDLQDAEDSIVTLAKVGNDLAVAGLGLTAKVGELETRVELAEADAVLLEALDARLAAVEARLNGEL